MYVHSWGCIGVWTPKQFNALLWLQSHVTGTFDRPKIGSIMQYFERMKKETYYYHPQKFMFPNLETSLATEKHQSMTTKEHLGSEMAILCAPFLCVPSHPESRAPYRTHFPNHRRNQRKPFFESEGEKKETTTTRSSHFVVEMFIGYKNDCFVVGDRKHFGVRREHDEEQDCGSPTHTHKSKASWFSFILFESPFRCQDKSGCAVEHTHQWQLCLDLGPIATPSLVSVGGVWPCENPVDVTCACQKHVLPPCCCGRMSPCNRRQLQRQRKCWAWTVARGSRCVCWWSPRVGMKAKMPDACET